MSGIPSIGSTPVTRDTATVSPTTPAEANVAPDEATRTLLAAADVATSEFRYSEAISFIERAIRMTPRAAALWTRLSAAHLADGNVAGAEQYARKAIALAGNDPVQVQQAWLQLAAVRAAQGHTSEAESIRRAYRSVPG